MAGGQACTGSQGTLIGEGGDNNFSVTGEASTGAAGTTALNRFHPIRSRRTGGGTALQALTGQAISPVTGTLVHQEGYVLTGTSVTGATGTAFYRGLATVSWNPNSESDLAGYQVLHGTTSGVYTDLVDVGNVTSYQWGGLVPGFTHYWVVRAYDNANPTNYSGLSAQVSKVY